MRTTVLQLSHVVLGLSALMLLPAVVALGGGDYRSSGDFLAASMVGSVLSGVMIAALRDLVEPLDRNGALVLAVLAWPVLALAGAMPLVLAGDIGFEPALFEALSALTTTGMTVYAAVDGLPDAILVWRALMQWYGGLVTLVILVFVLSPFGIGGHQPRGVSIGRHSASGVAAFGTAAVRQLAVVYAAGMVACFAWLLASGVDAVEAVCLALSAVSTGGLVPRDAPLDAYVPPAGQAGLILFMALGATSVFWHGMLRRLDLHQLTLHRESYFVIAAVFGLGIVLAAAYGDAAGTGTVSVLTTVRQGLFAAASLISTTGFHIRPESYSVLPLSVVLLIALVGGGAMSTAGGIKFFRCGVLATHAVRQLSHPLFPNAVGSGWIGSRHWGEREIQAVHTMALGAVFVAVVVMLVLAMTGLSFSEAITASVAATANVGPIYGEGPDATSVWLHPGTMGPAAHGALAVAMIAGRIEVLALFSVLNIAYWRRR